mgnify:CR=1 FL=1
MKAKTLIILVVVLLSLVPCCKDENDTDYKVQIREIAWASLEDQEKSTVIADWKQAPVAETTYMDKSVYSVTFNTSDDALLGPIIIYVDENTHAVLGQALRM